MRMMKIRKPVPDDPEHIRELANHFFHGIIPTKVIKEDEEPIPPKNTFHWEEYEVED